MKSYTAVKMPRQHSKIDFVCRITVQGMIVAKRSLNFTVALGSIRTDRQRQLSPTGNLIGGYDLGLLAHDRAPSLSNRETAGGNNMMCSLH